KRWLASILEAETVLDGAARAIHVMDREADSYAVLSALDETKRSFVIRSFQDRVLADEAGRLRDVARAAKRSFERAVPLSRRPVIDGPKYSRPQVGDQQGAGRFLIDFDRLAEHTASSSEGRDPTKG